MILHSSPGHAPAVGPGHHVPGAGVAGTARGGALNLVGAGVSAVAGLGVVWLAARSLGPGQAGVFFAGTAAFTLIAGAATLGTATGLVYWIARLRSQGRADLAAGCVRLATRPVTVATVALAVGLWLAAPWLSGHLAGDDQATGTLRALALFLPAAALADAFLSATRGWRRMRPTVALDRLLRPALQLAALATLAVAAAAGVAVPAVAWPVAWAAPWLPVALLAAYAARRAGGHPPTVADPPGPAMTRAFWRYTAPRAVANLLHRAQQRLDILLVAVLAGPAAAALYTVAGRFVAIGQLTAQALGQAVQPRLAERLAVGDTTAVRALYRTTTAWLVLLSWPLYLLVLHYAPLYLGLFGDEYREGTAIVAVLAAAMLLATACGTVDMLLAMAGRTAWNLLNAGLALAVLTGVCLLAVPRFGALGAAVGLAAAVTVNNLLPLAQVAYALRIHPFGVETLAAAALATGCFGVLPAVVTGVVGAAAATTGAAVAVAVVTYVAGAYRLRRVLSLDALAAARRAAPTGRAGAPETEGESSAR